MANKKDIETDTDLKETFGKRNLCHWCGKSLAGINPFITVIKRDDKNRISVREFCDSIECWVEWIAEVHTRELELEDNPEMEFL